VAEALGNTQSRAAVPVLIGMYTDDTVKDDVCGALGTLTHHQWCDGSGSVAETPARWRAWWRVHASALKLYGTGRCVPLGVLAPLEQ